MIRSASFVLVALVAAGCAARPQGPVPCGAGTDTLTTHAIHGEAGGSVIHASAVFDGEAVWIAYNVPAKDGSGNFDVLASRLDCGGNVLAGPVALSTTPGHNHVDPAVALSGDRLFVAWHADNGTGIDNLDIFFRVLERDGTPVAPTDTRLDPVRSGAPVTGNVWSPSVAPLPDGGVAIAGAWAIPESTSFQGFLQRLDADGALDGEATDLFLEPDVSQMNPTIAASPDGALHAAWDRDEGTGSRVARRALVAGVAGSAPVLVPEGSESFGAHHAAGPDGGIHVAYTLLDGSEYDVVLGDATETAPSPARLTLGRSGRLDHTPTIAPAPGGGAVAWFRNVSGYRNGLRVQAFTAVDGSYGSGTEWTMEGVEEALPYAPALTHVGDGTYFLAWSEGASPDIRLRARFVRP